MDLQYDEQVIETLKTSKDLYKIPMSKQLLLENLHITNKQLGKGSFGQVMLANDKLTQEEYAVKIIQRAKNQDAQIKYILQELKILSQLSHPNIVKFYSVLKDQKQYYIVMQYSKGGNLQQLLEEKKQKNEKLTENQVKQIIKHILEALYYLHSNDVVHRDIKLDNILLQNKNDYSSIKIVDFGLASEIDRSYVIMSDFCGTKLYMAPEILDEVYTKSVDIWSVGIILFQLLTNGNHPFYQLNDTQEEFFKKLQNKQEYDFSQDKLSPMAQDLLKRLICKNPSFRYNVQQALKHPFLSSETKQIPLTADQNLQAMNTIKQFMSNNITLMILEIIKKKSDFYQKRDQKILNLLEKYRIQIENQKGENSGRNKYKFRIKHKNFPPDFMKKTKFQKMKEYNQRLSNSSARSEDNENSATKIKKRNSQRKLSQFGQQQQQQQSQQKSSPENHQNKQNQNQNNNMMANIFIQQQQLQEEQGRKRIQSDDFICHSPNLRKHPQTPNIIQKPLLSQEKPKSALKIANQKQRSFKVLPISDPTNNKDTNAVNKNDVYQGRKSMFSKTAHFPQKSQDFKQQNYLSDQKNGQKINFNLQPDKLITDFTLTPNPKEIIKKRKSFQNGFPLENFPNLQILQNKAEITQGLPKIHKQKSKSEVNQQSNKN